MRKFIRSYSRIIRTIFLLTISALGLIIYWACFSFCSIFITSVELKIFISTFLSVTVAYAVVEIFRDDYGARRAEYAKLELHNQEKKQLEVIAEQEKKQLEVIAEKKQKLLKRLEEIREKEELIRSRTRAFEDRLYEHQDNPWLAIQYADMIRIADENLAHHLETKKHPALSAAAHVKAISKEKHALQIVCKQLEYQCAFYESLFPWLEEFKLISPREAEEYVKQTDTDYDNVKNWLSPEEYNSLSSVDKNQLALDRYIDGKKSNWEAGIMYERYVGFSYERKGYNVTYPGATLGLEDMGRDLIATNGKNSLVIQCKRWSKDKTIHEKHIFQLYGTTVLANLEGKEKHTALLITSANLSQTAKDCADYLGVKYRENFPLRPYPMIKCNVSSTGEHIYHLPFDQQYDRVIIEREKGEFYAFTVREAESAGFRHAYRWRA